MKKIIILALSVYSTLSFASSNFDGVPLNCSHKAKQFSRKHDLGSPQLVCRSRANPNIEYYTYCDGSGCMGFTVNAKKKCRLSDVWTGQDDQDVIDYSDWAEDCLIQADFNK